jgi:tRNA(adenine34) deaminase
MHLPAGMSRSDIEHFMRAAIAEAELAGAAGEFPIGAVLVIDGEIVSRGQARRVASRNQLAHAELQALMEAGERLWRDHDRAVLFSSLEPCPMCLGAAVMADVPHIIFASRDALVHSEQTVTSNPYVRSHIRTWLGGVLEAESRAVIGRYDERLLRLVIGAPARD